MVLLAAAHAAAVTEIILWWSVRGKQHSRALGYKMVREYLGPRILQSWVFLVGVHEHPGEIDYQEIT